MVRNFTSLILYFVLSQSGVSLAAISSDLDNRLKSCESGVAIAAAEEIIKSPDALKDPIQLFAPATIFFQHEKKDEAVFWFYAAQLRVRYLLASVDTNQGLTMMGLGLAMGALGPSINNYAFQDVSNFNRILDRVVKWDKATPNPYPLRDKAKWVIIDKAIEQMYSSVREANAKFIAERSKSESKAWLAAVEMRFQTEPVDPDLTDLKAKLSAERDTLESKARLAAPLIEMDNPKLFTHCH